MFALCAIYVLWSQGKGAPPRVFASVTVPSPQTRDRSIEARRAARLKKFQRERLVIDYLNRGVSIREIAVRLGVTEKRMRAIVREALAAHLPAPPEEFVALQISRLNEALLVAYSAMYNSISGANFKAINQVVKVVRELDRYHGFFPGERRSLGGSRSLALTEGEAEEPVALLADGSQMAPQALEKAQSGPENGAAPNASDEACASLADPAQAPSGGDAPQIERPEMAPQAVEKARSEPESAIAEVCSRGSEDPPGATSLPFAPLDAYKGMTKDEDRTRPETAPQPLEKAQSAPGNSMPPDASDEAFAAEAAPAAAADPDTATAAEAAPLAGSPAEEASLAAEAAPPAPLIAADVLLPPHARPQPGPTAFTGFIRCGGRVTYYQ
jgi:transposase-like protein